MTNRIWIAYSDPGGKNAVEPVARELEERGYGIEQFVGGWAAKGLSQGGVNFSTIAEAFVRLDAGEAPALMISSMCTTGGEPIIKKIMDRGLCPCLAVSDYPGGSMSTGQAWGSIRPTALTVTCQMAKELAEGFWQDFPPESIIVTGSPATDALAKLDVAKARYRARDAWRIPAATGKPVFLFAGGANHTSETLAKLAHGLDVLYKDVHLVVRVHPRFPDQVKKMAERVGAIIDRLPDSNFSVVGADVVFGCLSTMLETAACLHKPACNIYGIEHVHYPEIGRGDFLPVRLCCCAEATSWNELLELIEQAYSGRLAERLRPVQEDTYRLDGHNTKRVVAQCLHLIDNA